MTGTGKPFQKKHNDTLRNKMDTLFAINALPPIAAGLQSLYEEFGNAAYAHLSDATSISKADLRAIATEKRTTPLSNKEFMALAKAARKLTMS